jgi:D-aspartate ligase
MKQSMTLKPRSSAVVLGLGINGLAIVRCLAGEGIKVWGVYTREGEYGRFSRYCNAMRFPDMEDGEEMFSQELIANLGSSKEKPVLYSGSDGYVMFMSRNRTLLGKYFRFLLPDHELLASLTEKNLAGSYVSEKGLIVPKTHNSCSYSDIDRISEQIGYPCLVKPADSFTVNLGKKNMILPDEAALREFMKERPDVMDRVVIQQIVPGGDSNTYQATAYVSRDGGISSVFTMRKIRQYLPDYGVTCYGISEDVPQIREKVQNFLESIQYKGFISIEFKRHPDTGEWYYIEANPRLPYYHALISDSGINFPFICYQDMLGFKSDSQSLHQKNGIRWINFSYDIGSFARKYSKRQIKMCHWVLSVLKSRSFAIFDSKDVRPFIHSCADLIRNLLRRPIDRNLVKPILKYIFQRREAL